MNLLGNANPKFNSAFKSIIAFTGSLLETIDTFSKLAHF